MSETQAFGRTSSAALDLCTPTLLLKAAVLLDISTPYLDCIVALLAGWSRPTGSVS